MVQEIGFKSRHSLGTLSDGTTIAMFESFRDGMLPVLYDTSLQCDSGKTGTGMGGGAGG